MSKKIICKSFETPKAVGYPRGVVRVLEHPPQTSARRRTAQAYMPITYDIYSETIARHDIEEVKWNAA